MNSIIQDEKCCLICYNNQTIEEHHIFGAGLRKKSEKYGLKVYLCHNHHNENIKESPGLHHDRDLELYIKRLGQKAFQEHYPDLEFLSMFGRNYL